MIPTRALLLWVALLPIYAYGDLESCTHKETAGTRCRALISDLRPTQFAVGFHEVAAKTKELKNLSEDDLKKFIEKHPVPIVIGPGFEFFMLDHHHFAAALLRIDKAKLVIEIKKDAHELSDKEFWMQMISHHLVFLYDQDGHGPLNPKLLPHEVSKLKNDPYRSLSWAVRERGGYRKTDVLFAEFLWAQYFRPRIDIKSDGFSRAIKKGLEAARDPAAKDLPGYYAH